ncbi:MAG: NAD-dependent epimerase [Methylovulum sp.]|nr:NAD-dependent epimerase [Methylovulum sp.]MCF7997637.1 NAD-dependent epimerase [Methylovulum sp.]
MKVIVTGAAGFIGSALALKLLERGDDIVGIDNLNEYYDVNLKLARLGRLTDFQNFKFIKLDIADKVAVLQAFAEQQCSKVMHLAAQAGVRYSITNPDAYINSNIVGFMNILEASRLYAVEHLAYASTSSIYGANTRMPFSIHDNVDHPVSLYAASKKANELMAHTYSHLYQLPTTGLRFFTVYGPWGRPDMSPFTFTRNIIEDKPIDVFNYGNHHRDFTYIDDIVDGIIKVLDRPATPNTEWSGACPDPGTSQAPYRIYNIGNNNPINLLSFIETLENCLGKTAIKNLLPLQLGDIPDTYADISDLVNDFGYKPITSLVDGIKYFVDWYKEFYQVAG